MAPETSDFRNEPLTDFSQPENRKRADEAWSKVLSGLGREYDLRIGGESYRSDKKIRSINPSQKDQVVGVFQAGTAEHAARAVDCAARAFEEWGRTSPDARADLLFRAAAVMRRRKFELSATMVIEVGKTWPEADADTAEAIDFLEFYGREMLRYAGEQPLTRIASEKNQLRYIPLGVTAVIPPWNFPLAILTGMASAAIVAGNPVALKPSSDSPLTAWRFVEVMEEVGIPPGVLNFVSGGGSTVGDPLVVSPKTRLIAFTGSKEVGCRINETAARVMPGQLWLKRVIAEMGGKNAIIVDSDADLNAAVEAVAVSAFGYQGQKCSACSRLILMKDIHDAFVKKLVERVGRIRMGKPWEHENFMGPMINEGAQRSTLQYIEVGKKEGKLAAGGAAGPDANGFFVQPTVFTGIPPSGRLAQEEIFGPVLAVLTPARDLDDALRMANGTEFGLTAAYFGQNRARIEDVQQRFHVGNLYLNRKCTGALVGGHPFGGFNMSGTDSKAGGRDYLMLFTQAKAISEKIT
jgi:1-pyrroline-5-carboxylate dehydrogenase